MTTSEITTKFFKVLGSPTIYYIENGQMIPIGSEADFVSKGGVKYWTQPGFTAESIGTFGNVQIVNAMPQTGTSTSSSTQGTTGQTSTIQQTNKATDQCAPGATRIVGTNLETCTSFQGSVPSGAVTPGATWKFTKTLTPQENRDRLQAISYLTSQGYASPDEKEIESAIETVRQNQAAQQGTSGKYTVNDMFIRTINNNPTVCNSKTNTCYSNQDDLAKDLGVPVTQLGQYWGQIKPESSANVNVSAPTNVTTGTYGTDVSEYTLGQKLGLVYYQRPDLQAVFNPDGTAKPGTKWAEAGVTIENWAMMYGYKENPDLLGQYSPENMVKAAYINLFGPDRADDPGMQDWINAIKGGNIVSYNDLITKMRLDAGGEWTNLSPAQQIANEYDYTDLIHNDPDLSQYILGDTAKADIQNEVDTYYNKEKDLFLKNQGIVEHRTIEDWTRATTKLTSDERQDMDTAHLQFHDAIYNITTGAGALGMIFSSLRNQADQKQRDALARQQRIIALNAERAKNELDITKQRELEDLQSKQDAYMLALEKTKKVETEQTIANRQSSLFQDFLIAGKLGENIPGTQNIYGTAVGTPAAKFTIPTDSSGNLITAANAGTTTITCPAGQHLVNGICVPTTSPTTMRSPSEIEKILNTGGTFTEAEYQAYQASKK